VGLAVIYIPLLVVLLNSFNADTAFGWPPSRSPWSGGPG